MSTACKILLIGYAIFVGGYVLHCIFAAMETRRLHRMALEERAKREAEYARSKVINFPQAEAELPAGIRAPSTARRRDP